MFFGECRQLGGQFAFYDEMQEGSAEKNATARNHMNTFEVKSVHPCIHLLTYSLWYCHVQVSFIDSWLLTRNPLKKLLLRMMRKSNLRDSDDVLQRQIVYSFGDHYYFRKELKILNLQTGYEIFPFSSGCTLLGFLWHDH